VEAPLGERTEILPKQGRISFPSIAEQDQELWIETMFGSRRFMRGAGEVWHPERESRETLDRIRRTIGEYNFAGQYQQAPAPLGGGLVKEGLVPTLRAPRLAGKI
jgi:hypothetical protein